MSVIIILLGISLTVALVFLGAFIWASRTGQYDDTTTPAIRMLLDDEFGPTPHSSSAPLSSTSTPKHSHD